MNIHNDENIILGCPRPVREIIRGTYLHGFEKPLLNTAGETYKEGRRGLRIAGGYGPEGRMEGKKGVGIRGIEYG
jgi:hypothetical protein